MKHTRLDDLAEDGISDVGTSLDDLVGKWKNTKADSGHFIEAEVSRQGDQFYIQILAPGKPDPIDWGKQPIQIYYSGGKSDVVRGLSASFDFGFMETDLLGMVKYGVLVLMTFNRFKDESGRANYAFREFLHRMDRI